MSAKRRERKKLEPITLDEIVSAPGMSGFISFLNIPPKEERFLENASADPVTMAGPATMAPPSILTSSAGLPSIPESVRSPRSDFVEQRTEVLPIDEQSYMAGPAILAPPVTVAPPTKVIPPSTVMGPATVAGPSTVEGPIRVIPPATVRAPAMLAPPATVKAKRRTAVPPITLAPPATVMPPVAVPITAPKGVSVFMARRAQDAHTGAEQRLYDTLWFHKQARPETEQDDARQVTVGSSDLRKSTGLSENGLRRNLRSLEDKLAIEVVNQPGDFINSRTFRVFSYAKILIRRSDAGKVWVLRTRGSVDLVAAPAVTAAGPSMVAPPAIVTPPLTMMAPFTLGAPPPATVAPPPPATVAGPLGTDIRYSSEVQQKASSSSLAAILRSLRFDDAAASELIHRCRLQLPDVTDDEIAAAIDQKANQLKRRSNIENPVGLLLVSIPTAIRTIARDLRAAAAVEMKTATQSQRTLDELQISDAVEDQVWGEMGSDAKALLLENARTKLKSEPRWTRLSQTDKDVEIERYARNELRTKLEREGKS